MNGCNLLGSTSNPYSKAIENVPLCLDWKLPRSKEVFSHMSMTLQQSPWKKELQEEESEEPFGVRDPCLGEVDAGDLHGDTLDREFIHSYAVLLLYL